MRQIVLGHGSSLLNMAGHCAGALVFGIFLFLLARDRARSHLRGSGLAITAAALAFLWNAGALLLIALPDSPGWLSAAVQILSFGSLSMLAPVLLHLSLGHRCSLAFTGYAMGAVAVCLHVAHVVTARPQYHGYALGLMAVGLGGVTLVSAVHLVHTTGQDRQTLARRALGAALLFVFLGTYLHLGLEHGARTWSSELLLHHASVPLALLIIVHSHRFALLDALLRFCATAGLAVLFTLACLRLTQARHDAGDLERGALALGVCLLLLLFGLARDHLEKFMTRIVFRRGDSARLFQALRTSGAVLDHGTSYLEWALDRIAEFMRAARVRDADGSLTALLREASLTGPAFAAELPHARKLAEQAGVEVVAPVRLSSAETEFLLLGRRRGGQPYLSEDLDHLGRPALLVGEQAQTFREMETRRLAARAELRALQAQINPHFLFNALNTLYGLVPRQSTAARQTVLNLADIFRYFLRNENTTTPLAEELRIVEAYLEIEKLRLGGRLRQEIHTDPDALRVPIPILSIQPLVENAVKHGISSRPQGGSVRVEARLAGESLHILVADTGPGFPPDPGAGGAGIGLRNVARRLKLTYGPDSDLRIETGPEGTAVRFTVPAVQVHEAV